MPRKRTTRQKLYQLCDELHFDGMPPGAIAQYENFPYSFDDEGITDEYVLGTQEFAMLLVEVYRNNGMTQGADMTIAYASAVLWHWYDLNVRKNEFKETEIEI